MASRGRRRPRIRAELIKFFKRICADAKRVSASADVRSLSGLNAVGWRALAPKINALPALAAAGVALSASALADCRTIRDIESRLVALPVRDLERVRRSGGGGGRGGIGGGGGPRRITLDNMFSGRRSGEAGSEPGIDLDDLLRNLRGRGEGAGPRATRGGRVKKKTAPKKAAKKAVKKKTVKRVKKNGGGRRSPRGAPAPRPRQPLKPPPTRYANAALFSPAVTRRLPKTTSLTPGQMVRLRLDIGPLSAESQVENAKPLPSLVQRKADIDVMVSSTDFAVGRDADAVADGRGDRVAHGRFLLPDDGGEGRTPDGELYLTFHLRAPTQPGTARCRIGYYFRNALVQSQLLTAAVGADGGFSIRIDFTLSETLADLAVIPERPRLSVLTNDNGDGGHQIVIRHVGDTPAKAALGKTFVLRDATIGGPLKKLRKALEDRAPTKKSHSRDALIDDLTELAPLGWDLYSPVGAALDEALLAWKDKDQDFVIQVLRPDTSSFALPWGWCYDIPLDSKKKPWALCPMVEHWDEAKPLFDGMPRTCPHDHSDGNVLCPFGFIGLRYAIEQLARNDTPVLRIVSTPRCDFAVALTQYDLRDPKALETHIARLRAFGTAAKPPAVLAEGKTRDAVEKLLGGDVALIYFFCHGNRRNVLDPNVYLAVGNDEAITAQDFKAWLKRWRNKLKRWIWSEVRPLIFVNACHALAVEPETFVSYIDAFITDGHAAGVIGTEVKVAQSLAMDVGEQFFRRLLARTHTVDTALREIRLDYLAAGNLFGLVYTPYCWADLKMG